MFTNEQRQLFSGHLKKLSEWFIFSEYISDWCFNFIMVLDHLLFFKVGYQNDCYQNCKVIDTREDKKRKQIIPVLK